MTNSRFMKYIEVTCVKLCYHHQFFAKLYGHLPAQCWSHLSKTDLDSTNMLWYYRSINQTKQGIKSDIRGFPMLMVL